MPAEGVSPRAGTQGLDPSLGTGYFTDPRDKPEGRREIPA